jgi:hypothetical protein
MPSDLVTSPDKIVPNQQAQTFKNQGKATPDTLDTKQGQLGGPYDLKAIEESYRSLYGS